jgi:CRP-like cAMP-binding protein
MNPKVLEFVQRVGARDFASGQVLFREGDLPDNTMYFILSGEVGIFKNRPGGEREINHLGAGSFFGEMALVNQRPRLATARVVSKDARLVVLNKEILMKLAGGSPQFLFNLLKYSVTRLLAAEDKLQRVKEEVQGARKDRGLR